MSENGRVPSLADLLRGLRNGKHISQERFAANSGISKATYERFESGRQKPRSKTVEKICSGFKLAPTDPTCLELFISAGHNPPSEGVSNGVSYVQEDFTARVNDLQGRLGRLFEGMTPSWGTGSISSRSEKE